LTKPATSSFTFNSTGSYPYFCVIHGFTGSVTVKAANNTPPSVAITFFFTRCPISEFCPRLSRNFEEASEKLNAMPGGPTNWHFLSVTFDPEVDTPAVLRAYGERYQYDPKHWSFLTGPREQISELASGSNVKFAPASGFINHNFRTLIIDAAGHLQMIFPTSGNLSDAIVAEVLKAAAAGEANSSSIPARTRRLVSNAIARNRRSSCSPSTTRCRRSR
jgi:cytochrome oxidase Cu insertion factor (SCO1/SenC/PrrC family)